MDRNVERNIDGKVRRMEREKTDRDGEKETEKRDVDIVL